VDAWTTKSNNKLKIGDYVLATKYSDGDPQDHFYAGFFNGMLNEDRYMVIDSKGQNFKANGFRRCEKISPRVGNILVSGISIIAQSQSSAWYWRYHPESLARLVNASICI
jgi:hypothetical protein